KNAYINLDQVVVTGTGTHHKLKDTPVPIEVMSAADIKKAGITDFQTAMTMLQPSLSFSTNAMGSYLMMNGLSNKYVLILVNGKKLTGDTSNNIDLSQINMNNVKRIEVLKGAASALYGSDAIAGVINIITRKSPAKKAKLTAGVMGGSFGTLNADASVSGTLKNTQYTLGISSVNSRGFSSAAAPDQQTFEKDGYNDLGLNAGVVQKITDKLSANALIRYQKYDTDLDEAAYDDKITPLLPITSCTAADSFMH
ncbi:MAG: TonB-dependent receptor plug domain-containing protein, partial [Leadbetterella sp.]|nr:TonB-dependent receptor plug domain-containing protein [Leadbetterella sp.]